MSKDKDSSNVKQEWEVEAIIDEETRDGKLYYLVKWAPSLATEDDMGNAVEAVRDWQRMKSKIKVREKRVSEKMSLKGPRGTKGAKGVKGVKGVKRTN